MNNPTIADEALNRSVKYMGVIEFTEPIPSPVKRLRRKKGSSDWIKVELILSS